MAQPNTPPRPFKPVLERLQFLESRRGVTVISLEDSRHPNANRVSNILSRQGFGRNTKTGQPGRGNGQQLPSPTSQGSGSQLSVTLGSVPHSPGPNSAMSFDIDPQADQSQHRKPPYFFREEYSGLIVKGNFMTLAAKPAYVEEGEWLAHQGESVHSPRPDYLY